MNLVSVLLRWLLILALLLPSAPATAETDRTPDKRGHRPSEAANQATLGQTVPPVTEMPEPTPWPTVTPTTEPPANTPEPPELTFITPTLPVYVELAVERLVLTTGATLYVTATVTSFAEGQSPAATLTLNLPTGLRTTTGESGLLSWPLEPLANGTQHAQPVLLEVDSAALGAAYGVLSLEATVSASGYTTADDQTLLGIAPSAQNLEVTQTSRGAVLQDGASGMTLLIPAAAAGVGVDFAYTPLFRGDQPPVEPESTTAPEASATAIPSATASASPTLQTSPTPAATSAAAASGATTLTTIQASRQPAGPLYLPLVTQENAAEQANHVQASQTLTASQPITTLQVITSDGLRFYQMWELDAAQDSQPMTHFDQPLLLVLEASWLVAGGVDPVALSLWTRESPADEWQMEELLYDERRQVLMAWLFHFSSGGIGSGLDNRGEILPSLRGVNSERFTGAANISYPIEVPAGLGGMAPQLSLSYSSNTVDDVMMQAGDDGYEVQASLVGYGWNLSGLSYVDRSLRGDGGFYSLVLNGMRSTIDESSLYLETDYFTKIQRTQGGIGAFHGWTVTTPDGTVYTFGDTRPSDTWPTSQNSQSMAVSLYLKANGSHDFDHWYLQKVTDPLDNRMTFTYEAQRGVYQELDGGDCDLASDNDKSWYTRSVAPTAITWSGNPTQGQPETLRVRFEYAEQVDGIQRPDIDTPGWDQDCNQRKYFAKRLSAVYVEVMNKDNTNNWDTLRKYVLDQSNLPGPAPGPGDTNSTVQYERHMLLDNIQHYGKGGSTLLNTYSFSYARNSDRDGTVAGMTTNNIRLISASNGWGGSVDFAYSAIQIPITRCQLYCNGRPADQTTRFPVTTETVKDGLGSQTVTSYAYANPAARGDYEDVDTLYAREFMGFEQANATYYERSAVGTTGAPIRFDDMFFTQGQMQTAITTPRDPRLGKMQWQRIWSKTASTCTVGSPENGYCLLHELYSEWGAYWRNQSNGVWSTWTNQTGKALWVRQDRVRENQDGAWHTKIYLYETTRQNGYQYGNLTQVNEYDGSVIAANPTEPVLRSTISEYFPNPTAYIINKPGSVRVFAGASNCKSEVRTIYDNVNGNYNVMPTVGVVKKIEQASSVCSNTATIGAYDAGWIVTRMATDAYGKVTALNRTAADAGHNDVTVTSYETTYNLFPIQQSQTITAPNGVVQSFVETAKYYGVNGLAVSDGKAFWGATQEYCGVNELCTRQSYDGFGRPLRRWERAAQGSIWGSDADAHVKWDYYAPGQAHASQQSFIVMEWRAPRCYGNFTRQLYNGLGQLVQVQTPQQDRTSNADGCNPGSAGDDVDVNYAYDALGNAIRVSTPRSGARGLWYNRHLTSWSGVAHTYTTYDALGRVTSMSAPNGEQSTQGYSGRATWVIGKGRAGDGDKKLQRHELDALGHLRSLRNELWDSSTSQWVADGEVLLSHDVLGNLTQVTHAEGAGATSMSYDAAGRKTSISDPDLGSWSYAYDRQGNLTRQTDARGKTICLSYDTSGRLFYKDFRTTNDCTSSDPAADADVTYTYDSGHSNSNRSRGQLTQVKYNDSRYQKNLTYNNEGLLASENVQISGGLSAGYTTNYGYGAYDRPSTATHPDNETLTVSYNSMGLPAKLASSSSGDLVDGTTNVVAVGDAVNYDLAGRLTQMRFPAGRSLWRRYEYDPWDQADSNGGMLTGIKVGTTSTAVNRLDLNYSYDSFGNVKQILDGANTATFSYDAHNRLTSNYFGQGYGYDDAGRITSFEDRVQSYSTPKDSANPHAVKWANIGQGTATNRNVVVRAYASSGCSGWPLMEMYVNGVQRGQVSVNSTAWQNYSFSLPLSGRDQIEVVFNNDCTTTGDRNLVVDYIDITVGTTTTRIQAEGPTILDYGAGDAKFDGVNLAVGGQGLYSNSALRFVVAPDSNSAAYGYDANGNVSYKLINGQADLFTFDHENRLTEIKRNGAVLESYVYDVDGQRVKKTVGTTATYYYFPHYEVTGSTATKYYFFAGMRIAMRTGTTLYYLHGDHLGSSSLATDSTGSVGNPVRDQGYYAYGRYRRGGTLPTDHKFTGQKLDGSGLYY